MGGVLGVLSLVVTSRCPACPGVQLQLINCFKYDLKDTDPHHAQPWLSQAMPGHALHVNERLQVLHNHFMWCLDETLHICETGSSSGCPVEILL